MVEAAAGIPGASLVAPRSALTYALRPELKNLRCPTLILWGDKDTFGPPSLGYEMAQLMPHARCVTVPDAEHGVWLDRPDVCAREIESFLA